MIAALIADTGKEVDVHAFTQDFIMAFANSDKQIDTSTCYQPSVVVEDEVARQDGIADCLAPSEMITVVDEIFSEGENIDRTDSRIASGIYFLGVAIPDIVDSYKECEEMKPELDILMGLYDKHFTTALGSLYTFSGILVVA